MKSYTGVEFVYDMEFKKGVRLVCDMEFKKKRATPLTNDGEGDGEL